MNRLVALCIVIISISGAIAFAQSSPSEQTVLDQARDTFKKSQKQVPVGEEGSAPADWVDPYEAARQEAESEPAPKAPFSPFVISFVPGLSFPFGTYWDTPLAVGSIGSIANTIYGFQGAGVFSIASGDVFGFQGAGVFNIAERLDGFQGAGIFNIAKGGQSIQAAGVFNILEGEADAIQMAGVFNTSDGKIDGIQAAGVFNVADECSGLQMAGIVNIADKVDGVQIGLVNVCGEMNGLAIGLVNIVKYGLQDIGAFYIPDTGLAFAEYRAGSNSLFSVWELGIPRREWFTSTSAFVGGFGFGSRSKLFGFGLDLEILAEQCVRADLSQVAWEAVYPNPGLFLYYLAPYPVASLTASMKIFGDVEAFVGLRCEFDFAGYDAYPDDLWTASDARETSLFGVAFTVHPRWYFGFRL